MENNQFNQIKNTNEGIDLNEYFLNEKESLELKRLLLEKGYNFLDYGAMLGSFGEKGFTGDGSSLFCVVKKDGKNLLYKLGWGEFSHETFSKNPKTYPESCFKLQKLPIDMFVVDQQNSYFKIKENLVKTGDVINYIKEYANFGFVDGKLQPYRAWDANDTRIQEVKDFNTLSMEEFIEKMNKL